MLSDTTTLDVMPLPSVSNDPLATLLASTHVNMQSPTHRRRRRLVEVCTTGRDRSCGDNDRIMNTVYEGHGGSGAELGGDGEGGGELKVRMAAPSARRYSQPIPPASLRQQRDSIGRRKCQQSQKSISNKLAESKLSRVDKRARHYGETCTFRFDLTDLLFRLGQFHVSA